MDNPMYYWRDLDFLSSIVGSTEFFTIYFDFLIGILGTELAEYFQLVLIIFGCIVAVDEIFAETIVNDFFSILTDIINDSYGFLGVLLTNGARLKLKKKKDKLN